MFDRVSHSDSSGSKVPAGNCHHKCPVVLPGFASATTAQKQHLFLR